MNTQLKQNFISHIDELVEQGVYSSDEEAVDTAMTALHWNEIEPKIQAGLEQVKKGETITVDSDYLNDLQQRVKKRVSAKRN
ncbi:MAG: hypothetical protein GKR95_24600 [Gammaproteobacteria bacterium]|nr:hypothetical protein [Gammaproteobacteria bacterium]NKB65146.1 hypothetical protein [Gammaproteobacteria bacterium]